MISSKSCPFKFLYQLKIIVNVLNDLGIYRHIFRDDAMEKVESYRNLKEHICNKLISCIFRE